MSDERQQQRGRQRIVSTDDATFLCNEKTADYHLIRLLRRMRLRNKLLSIKYAPDLGDVDTYLFFEKTFRSEIRMCVTVT